MSCKFQALEEIVRDKFVVGLANHEKFFDRLCEENESITSKDALTKAMILETKFKTNDQTVNFIKRPKNFFKGNKGQQRTGKNNNNNAQAKAKTTCTHCGWRNHTSPTCKYKEATCNICGKRGYLATICRFKSDKRSNANNSNAKTVGNIISNNANFFPYRQAYGDSLSMYMVEGTHASDSSGLNIAINGIPLRGKCDTGAPCSLMSAELYDRHFDRKTLLPYSGDAYKDYGGHPIPNFGEFNAFINCGDQTKNIRMIVTKYTNRPLLLGSDFLDAFGFKLTRDGKTLSDYDRFVNAISDTNSIIVSRLKSEFSDVFKNELGTYSGTKVHLEVNSDARPVFFKPRPIPYAWKDRIEAQLNNLVQIGMLEPVENSDWGWYQF